MFERNWRARVSRHEGIELSPEPNAIGNCFHTELKAGQVIMTASAVESASELVREAVFRKSLAQDSQLEMFLEPEPPPADAMLYAILLHGPLGAGLLPAPAFIHVGFPGADCDSYVDKFNLLDYFPLLESEMEKLPKPSVQERKKPRLRRDRDRRDRKAE
jgi:hypothetical protein